MNKDVIYIDVEDDITAVIGKVKDAKEKIVAIVPPKRIGVLQSAVNLRLLSRAAEQEGKRLVLISNNSALVALAAAAKIPVAKNLQSKPEMAEIAALDVDNGEDVIDGSQLPVGELARTAGTSTQPSLSITDSTLDELDDDTTKAAPPAPGQQPKKPRAKNGMKVPNFNKFRKKLVFMVGGGVLLLGFLIWAIFFAPHATVVIAARTTDTSANPKITLSPTATTDASANTLKTSVQQIKKDSSISFDATGKKDVGDKAKGTVSFSTQSIGNLGATIPAGTSLTSSTGRVYTTDSSVTITIQNYNDASTGITASASGDDYNGASGSMSGAPSGISASIKGSTSGGTSKTITVVTAADIQKATEQLNAQNTDDIKKQLTGQFGKEYTVIEQSFKIDRGTPTSSPAVDQELSSGQAKLTSTTTYSLSGIAKSDVSSFLTDYFNSHLDNKNNQRVYDNGSSKVTFMNVTPADAGFTANLVATAKVGPKIDDEAIKNQAKGKRYGDIQSSLESIDGVDNVDVKFWPFWVSSAPNDIKKISVEFNLNESK